ncbi:DUF4105 domain-containing protein [Litorivivens sp.]|uniref:Lnb N-terminal periplasmic domain-containing protein n=2 Tax=Litorivivens sp. TaxID=2020868 RepID=UPI003566D1D9
MTTRRYWGLLLLLVFAVSARAQLPLSKAGLEGSTQSPSLDALADHPQWRALLHYGRAKAGYERKSYVDDPAFFLSVNGRRDARAELQATVEQLQNQATLRCQFIARFRWLQQQGALDSELPAACDGYRQWRGTINAGAVALVFAASYLNSPSSMYGHTFLRVDPQGYRAESALLSYAVNYAAVVPDNDSSLLFAWRGMSGGYPGHFSLQPYVDKLQEYSRLENRDVWEYELNLNAAEIDRLMAHLWELQSINFDYYFMDENCSFRLLELLEVARPGLTLTAEFPVHAIPVDTVRAVREAGLVDEVVYRPSRQRELDALVAPLDAAQRQWVLTLAREPAQNLVPAFQRKSVDEQRTLLLGAYRLLRYQHNRQQRSPDVAGRSFALLRAINHLPPDAGQSATPVRPTEPDAGHATALAGLALGRFDERDYREVSLRLTYHDLLDPVAGYPRNASLNMLQATLRQVDGEGSRLQSLTLVDIRSLAPRTDFFQPISWQARGGLERSDGHPDYLAPYASGGAGGSWQILGVDISALATLRAEYNEGFENNWQAAPGLTVRGGLQREHVAAALEAEHYRFANGVERNTVGLSLNVAVAAQHGIRFNWRRVVEEGQGDEDVSLQWRYYF